MAKKSEPPGAEGADASLSTLEIERILSNFIAERGGIRPPYAYVCKWLWVAGKGPTVHVDVTRAASNVRPTPSRFVRKKGT